MAQIAIVGGNGKIARQLIPALKAAGHRTLALVRNTDHAAELEVLGAKVGVLDIENSTDSDFGVAFAGSGLTQASASARNTRRSTLPPSSNGRASSTSS